MLCIVIIFNHNNRRRVDLVLIWNLDDRWQLMTRSGGTTRLAFELNFGLCYVIFKEMLLEIGVDPSSQHE